MCKIGRLVCIGDGADTGAASRPEGRFLLKLFSVRATPMGVGLVKVDLGLRVPSKPEWHHCPIASSAPPENPMLVKSKDSSFIPSSEITPKNLYVNRRDFLKSAGI